MNATNAAVASRSVCDAASVVVQPGSPLDPRVAPLLVELDALDESGAITEAGRAMVRLPLHPRLSHMLHAAQRMGAGALACDIAALLSERDIFTGE